jgi:hypothetical protein
VAVGRLGIRVKVKGGKALGNAGGVRVRKAVRGMNLTLP